jgi:hypothetical protein
MCGRSTVAAARTATAAPVAARASDVRRPLALLLVVFALWLLVLLTFLLLFMG